jgi:hypothetical protein
VFWWLDRRNSVVVYDCKKKKKKKMISLSRIQSTLQLLNEKLFHIKDITRIIDLYARSFPVTVVSETNIGPVKPCEIKWFNGVLLVNAPNQRMIHELKFNAASAVTNHSSISLSCKNDVFGFDVNESKIMMVSSDGDGGDCFEIPYPFPNHAHCEKTQIHGHRDLYSWAVVLDKRNNCFYRNNYYSDSIYVFDYGTYQMQKEYKNHRIVVNICLCSPVNLLAVLDISNLTIYSVPSFELKFQVDLKQDVSICVCLCFAAELNCVVVALENKLIYFYNVHTGKMVKLAKINFIPRGITYDSQNGTLIASNPDRNQLVVLG